MTVCIICHEDKPLTGIGSFGRCCPACAAALYARDMESLGITDLPGRNPVSEAGDSPQCPEGVPHGQ